MENKKKFQIRNLQENHILFSENKVLKIAEYINKNNLKMWDKKDNRKGTIRVHRHIVGGIYLGMDKVDFKTYCINAMARGED